MPVDLSEFDAAVEATSHPRCKIAEILGSLDDGRAKSLSAAMAGHYPSSTIVRVLAGWDVKVAASTIKRHRHRDCSCR